MDAAGFDAGTLAQLSGVPANTHGARVAEWFSGGELERNKAFTGDIRARTARRLGRGEFPRLGVLADAVRALAERHVLQDARVRPISARAVTLERFGCGGSEDNKREGEGETWRLSFDGGASPPLLVRGGVVLATGAAPRAAPPELAAALARAEAPPVLIPARVAMDPEAMAAQLANLGSQRVGVVGRSHSGVLAARNAVLAGAVATLFHDGKPMRLAVDRGSGINMLWDFTGLKGEAAAFASEYLLQGGAMCECGTTTQLPYETLLAPGGVDAAQLDALVVCVGYERSPPVDYVDGARLSPAAVHGLDVDAASCRVVAVTREAADAWGVELGTVVGGLYGAGIAFAPLYSFDFGRERGVGIGVFKDCGEIIAADIARRLAVQAPAAR